MAFFSEEARNKIRETHLGNKYNLGRKASVETRLKMSLIRTGKKHPPRSEETLRRMSEAQKRKKASLETRKKLSLIRKGRITSLETKLKLSELRKGDKNPGWRGGVMKEHNKIRKSMEYRLWRTAVYERDNYTCIWCHKRGGKLQADHIKPFSLFPELRFAIDNGRTLCMECHKKTDTYGWKLQKHK